MFKKSVIFLFSLILCISVFGQNSNDSIQVINVGSNYRCEQNGHVLNLRQITQLMKTDKEATKYLKSAKLSNGISVILGCAGGFLIGYPIGTYIAGRGVDLSMLAVGISFLVVDIPVNIATKRNLIKAINHYNSNQSGTGSMNNAYDIQMGLTQNGIGITLRF